MNDTEGYVVGIDYSMTCPSMCIFNLSNGNFGFSKCQFVFQIAKKFDRTHDIVPVLLPKTWNSREERWDFISEQFVSLLEPFSHSARGIAAIGIEEYSFASKSNNMFHVGEHTGVLRHKIHKRIGPVTSVNITHVKRMSGAEGGGNATKGQILRKFQLDDPVGYETLLGTVGIRVTSRVKSPGKKTERIVEMVDSPAVDIIDSYYLTKFLVELVRGNVPFEEPKKTKKKSK